MQCNLCAASFIVHDLYLDYLDYLDTGTSLCFDLSETRDNKKKLNKNYESHFSVSLDRFIDLLAN